MSFTSIPPLPFSISISLKDDDRRPTSPFNTNIPSPISTAASQSEPASYTLSHIDRDSAIALGVILILIILASLYYVYLHIKHKREADIERQMESLRRDTLRRYGSVGNRPANVNIGFRMNSLWSKSGSTLRGSVSTQGGKGKSVSSTRTSGSSASGSASGSVDSNTLYVPSLSRSRSPSPHSDRRTSSISHYVPSLPEQNSSALRVQHRRQSSIHSLPAAFVAERRASAPLNQSQVDQKWWTDVTRRGSTARSDRRFRYLATIPEPEVPDGGLEDFSVNHGGVGTERYETQKRNYTWTRPGSTVPVPESVLPSSSRAAVGGVGSKSVLPLGVIVPGVVPEYVSDEDGESVTLGDFKSIVWDKNVKRRMSDMDDNVGPGPEAGASEGVQTVDWAMKASVSDARRQTTW